MTVVKKVDFSYMPIGQPSLKTRSPPRRRPNSARRLRPGFAPGNTELIPAQATPRVSPRTTAGTGLGRRLRFPSRCCAASAGLSCPEIAPQYVQTCFTRFLTGTVKATCTPLSMGVTVVKKVDFSYMPIGQPFVMTRSTPRRRPNCSRRLRPGLSPGNTERIPVQAIRACLTTRRTA